MPKIVIVEKHEILRLKDEGLNQKQIAEQCNCTQSHISNLSRKYNVTWPIGAAARDQTGAKNPMYKGGLSRSRIERLTRKVVLDSGRSLYICERCEYKTNNYEHARHHRDRDRSNNEPSNIEVLCRTCHRVEHASESKRGLDGKFY